MTEVAEQQSIYASRFHAFVLEHGGPAWLLRTREEAIDRFSALGFPTTRDEEWRFTNVAPIARTVFEPGGGVPEPSSVEIDSLLYAAPGECRLIFVNGRFSPGLSRIPVLPGGAEAGSLAASLRSEAQLPQDHFARYAAFQGQAFVALNTAFFEDGAFVHIPKGVVLETPIHLVFVSTAGAAATCSHPRNLIVAERGCQATLVETYLGLGEQVYLTNAVTEIVTGDNAVLDHYKLQIERDQAFHTATMQVKAGRASNFSSHSISLGGALVRNDANVVLSEGTEATLNGLYLVQGRQHVDNHTVIDHAKPHGASHELYKGILDGQASAVFNGRILVRPDAQKTDSKQTNKNLVLSEDAVINTKPELQIFADDVRCTHGATIGQLDAEAIFYLQSRGIGREQARDLLTYAFARDIIERIRVEALRDRLEQVLFERLHVYRQ